MKARKIVVLLLCIVLSLGLAVVVSGCGAKKSGDAASTAADSSDAANSDAATSAEDEAALKTMVETMQAAGSEYKELLAIADTALGAGKGAAFLTTLGIEAPVQAPFEPAGWSEAYKKAIKKRIPKVKVVENPAGAGTLDFVVGKTTIGTIEPEVDEGTPIMQVSLLLDGRNEKYLKKMLQAGVDAMGWDKKQNAEAYDGLGLDSLFVGMIGRYESPDGYLLTLDAPADMVVMILRCGPMR
jgi:hypothetical protein